MLTKRTVEEFKEIYLRRYGVALTDADATELAANLLNFYRAVYPATNMKMKSVHEKKLQSETNQG